LQNPVNNIFIRMNPC